MDVPEGIKFVVMVNKQGHTRFSKWMQHVEDDPHRRRMMEYELVRKCMPRDIDHVGFLNLMLCVRARDEIGISFTFRLDRAGKFHSASRLYNCVQKICVSVFYRRYRQVSGATNVARPKIPLMVTSL